MKSYIINRFGDTSALIATALKLKNESTDVVFLNVGDKTLVKSYEKLFKSLSKLGFAYENIILKDAYDRADAYNIAFNHVARMNERAILACAETEKTESLSLLSKGLMTYYDVDTIVPLFPLYGADKNVILEDNLATLDKPTQKKIRKIIENNVIVDANEMN